MSTGRTRDVALIVVAGIVARLVVAPLVILTIRGDSSYYLAMAENLRDFGVFGEKAVPQFFRPPLYADFLAGLLYLGGDIKFVVAAVQSVLTIASALVLYVALARPQPRLALFAALAVAVSPFGILNDSFMLQESLYTSVMIITVALAYRLALRGSGLVALGVGILCGILSLIRDAYLFLPLFLVVFLILAAGRSAAKYAGVVLIAYALTLSPWLARNASLPNGGMFLSKGILGANLWIGTWLTERADLPNDNWGKGEDIPEHAFASDAEKTRVIAALRTSDDGSLTKIAISRIIAAPASTLLIWIKRAPGMWLGTRILPTVAIDGLAATALKAALYALDCAVILLGLAGMALVLLRWDRLLIFTAPIAYIFAVYFPLYNIETRYSAAAMPFLYLFCVLAFLAFRDRFAGHPALPVASRPSQE